MSEAMPVTSRGALPEEAQIYRSIGPFDAQTVPKGLLGKHDLKPGAWARLCVTGGSVSFVWDDPQGGIELSDRWHGDHCAALHPPSFGTQRPPRIHDPFCAVGQVAADMMVSHHFACRIRFSGRCMQSV